MTDRGVKRGLRGRLLRSLTAAAGISLALATASCGQDSPTGPPPPAELTVLFVGNSLTYSNDLPGMLRTMLEDYSSLGSVYVESVALPNFGLQDHWVDGRARERIAEGGWDVVIVQQGPSATEGRPSLIEYSGLFADEVEAIGGRLAVYMVWPSIQRSGDFQGVSDSHVMAAEQAGALLFPAGEAWRAAFASDITLDLYGPDGLHPNLAGSYLAALVMYEQLSGLGLGSLPAGIVTPERVIPLIEGLNDTLHEAAAEANENFATPAASPR